MISDDLQCARACVSLCIEGGDTRTVFCHLCALAEDDITRIYNTLISLWSFFTAPLLPNMLILQQESDGKSLQRCIIRVVCYAVLLIVTLIDRQTAYMKLSQTVETRWETL